MILLDTHVLVWLAEANQRLGPVALKQINKAFQGGKVYVSAISYWEIGMLVEKGRIRMDLDLAVWRNDYIKQGLNEVSVTGEIGIKAAGFQQFHGDPADRIIAATALQNSLTLFTADKKLLDCDVAISRMDARI